MYLMSSNEYAQLRRDGYAGPLLERQPRTQQRWGRLGATHWVLRSEGASGTTLGPARVKVDIPPALREQYGEHSTDCELREFVAAVEHSANEGNYRGAVLPHGVLWLAVAAHGTEAASPAAMAVLDAAYAEGRVIFHPEPSLPGDRIVVD